MKKIQKATKPKSKVFSDFELSAMKERAQELLHKGDGESVALAKISEMEGADRVIAERIHALMKQHAPMLSAKTWYGMPAYANKVGKVVCFFQSGKKYKVRYSTLGFTDTARLDEGDFWPASFAVTKLTPAVEAKIIELVIQAIG